MTSRRQFVVRLTLLCLTPAISVLRPRALAATDAASRAQWARLQRGLDQRTLATYRDVAMKLAPRAPILLKGADWESQIISAMISELKKANAYPERQPPLDDPCAKEARANRLRGEAGDVKSTPSASAAAVTAAASTLAIIPVVGPVIAAVLAAIAAVIMIIGQLAGAEAGMRDTVAKQTPTPLSAEALERLRKVESLLVKRLELQGDCALFGRKAS